MKVIDLLNKIANGEEVSKYVIYYNMLKEKDDIMYVCKDNLFYKLDQLEIQLNSRVEEIEESQEHKIPEKLIPTSLRGIDNLDEKIEVAHVDTINAIDKINEIIDYLEKQNDNNSN